MWGGVSEQSWIVEINKVLCFSDNEGFFCARSRTVYKTKQTKVASHPHTNIKQYVQESGCYCWGRGGAVGGFPKLLNDGHLISER